MENRRKSQRAVVAISAEIEIDGDTLIGETHDLSAGGVSVIVERGVEEGASLAIALVLTEDGIEHADEHAFESRAVVVWASPTDTGQTLLGLRFNDLPPPQAQHLERFLRALTR